MKKKGALIVLLVQSLLMLVGFNQFFSNFSNYLFQNEYDGYKNYLTFHAYVIQPQDGLMYTQMNYPFGDFIFFTDNTPLLAVFTRFCVKLFPQLANYDLQWFNGWCLVGILVASLVLHRLFRKLNVSPALSMLFAITLPWLSPQFNRLSLGHFNLSFSFLIPLVLLLCLNYYRKVIAGNSLDIKGLLGLTVLLYLAPFLHIYYLPLLVMVPVGIGASWLAIHFWRTRQLSAGAIGLLISSAIAGVATFFTIRLLDAKRHLRLTHAEGYDWEHWKLNFSGMFTTPGYMKVKFPFAYAREIMHESYIYMGGGVLFLLLLVIAIRLIFKRNLAAHVTHDLRKNGLSDFYLFFTCTAVVGLMMALGEEYYFFNYEYKFINILNPLYYLHKVTRMVEQFRCLGRFAWVFFWWVNISGVLMIDRMYRTGKTVKVLRWLLVPVIGIVMADTYSLVKTSNGERHENDVTNTANMELAKDLLQNVETSRYQAILPVPYYHIGAEDYTVSIDPEEPFFKLNTQMSLLSHLPQMSSKMSRSAVIEAKALCSLFVPGIGEADYLKARMQPGKPVLVIFWKTYYANLKDRRMPDKEPAKSVVLAGPDFVKGLPLVKETAEYALYEWTP